MWTKNMARPIWMKCSWFWDAGESIAFLTFCVAVVASPGDRHDFAHHTLAKMLVFVSHSFVQQQQQQKNKLFALSWRTTEKRWGWINYDYNMENSQ
jgi:hypothetical protein